MKVSSSALGYLVSQYPAVNHTFILREIQSLRQAGFDIRVVSIRRSDRAVSSLSDDEAVEQRQTYSVLDQGPMRTLAINLRVFLSRPLDYLGTLFFTWSLTACTPRLLLSHTIYFLEAVVAGAYFERVSAKHIHTHFSSTVLLILSRLFKIPYSLTIHGPDEFNDVAGFRMAQKVAGASFVATISQYAASQVMRASDPVHWNKIYTLPLGVDATTLVPRQLPFDGSRPFRLVFVGRLAPAKAPHLLVQSIAMLVSAGRKVELTVVGDGASRPDIEALVRSLKLQDAIRLVGACNHDKVVIHYRESDAFVLASFAEGVPVVLMEAMAMQLPCVATWITGIPELIVDGVEGLLVPPASAESIANAVMRLMDDGELRQRLGKAGRAKVLAKYHLGANTTRLGEVFRKVAGF